MYNDAVTSEVPADLFCNWYPMIPVPAIYSSPDQVYASNVGTNLYAKLALSNIKSAINLELPTDAVPKERVCSAIGTLSNVVEYNRNLDSEVALPLNKKKLFFVVILPDTPYPVVGMLDPETLITNLSVKLSPIFPILYASKLTIVFPKDELA